MPPPRWCMNVEDGAAFAAKIGYPVVLRPAYTLGGSGGGIADNPVELEEILGKRPASVAVWARFWWSAASAGWKEIEYEVMRDSQRQRASPSVTWKIIDPVGVHTGDSIVMAPSQTLGGQGIPDAAKRRA